MKHEFHYQVDDQVKSVALEAVGDHWLVQVGKEEFTITVAAAESGRLLVEIDGRRLLVHTAQDGETLRLHVNGETWRLLRCEPGKRRRSPGADRSGGSLSAAMPGRVLDVLVAPGDIVRKGDPLVLLEAMKMELRIVAPLGGRVHAVHCQPGQVVERGQLLVEVGEITSSPN